jgi:hypothetical protein
MSSTKLQATSLGSSADETRTFEKGKIEIVNFHESGIAIGRGTFELGWS